MPSGKAAVTGLVVRRLDGSISSSQIIDGHGGCPFIRAKKYWPGFASKWVIGLDFFLFSFFLLCSGTADDLFLEDPPTLARLFVAGVPLLVGGWAVRGVSSVACRGSTESWTVVSLSCEAAPASSVGRSFGNVTCSPFGLGATTSVNASAS